MDTKVNLVLCTTESGGIGLNNTIPWRSPLDMRYFKGLTTGAEWTRNEGEPVLDNYVIMGRKTWNSLPNGALPGRGNYVITSSYLQDYNNAMSFGSIGGVLTWINNQVSQKGPSNHWVIGGASIYDQFLDPQAGLKYVDHVYLNTMHKDYECDTFVNGINDLITTGVLSEDVAYHNTLNKFYEYWSARNFFGTSRGYVGANLFAENDVKISFRKLDVNHRMLN